MMAARRTGGVTHSTLATRHRRFLGAGLHLSLLSHFRVHLMLTFAYSRLALQDQADELGLTMGTGLVEHMGEVGACRCQ